MPGFVRLACHVVLPSKAACGFQDCSCTALCTQSVLEFKGGETVALERLKYYLWDTDLVAKYFTIRHALILLPHTPSCGRQCTVSVTDCKYYRSSEVAKNRYLSRVISLPEREFDCVPVSLQNADVVCVGFPTKNGEV